MEKVQPTFQYKKFWLSFAGTGFAFVTLPLMTLDLVFSERRLRSLRREEEALQAEINSGKGRSSRSQTHQRMLLAQVCIPNEPYKRTQLHPIEIY